MEQSQGNSAYLGSAKIGRLLAKFAVPCIISMLVNSLYNIVDQIFIGQGVGPLGNAATSVTFPFVTISMAFALLIGDGGAAYLSLRLGAREVDDARRGAGNALTVLIFFGVFFFAAGMIFLDPLLRLFGGKNLTQQTFDYAHEYGRIILIGFPFVIVSTGLNSMIRADGSPKYAMIAMLSGAILNTILDPIFIFVCGWGVAGAAWATIIGQFVGFAISIFYLTRFRNFKLKGKDLIPKWKIFKRVSEFGTSSFITQLAITVVVIVMNNVLVKYGAASKYGADTPLAAFNIVMKVNQILIALLVGIAVGGQPIIGFNYGAKNFHRVRQTYFLIIRITLIVGAVAFCCFMFLPKYIVMVFGQADELYNEFAVMSFRINLCCCIFTSFQIPSAIFFQSVGKPVKATLLSLSRQVLFLIPLALILPIFFGVTGALCAAPVADFMAFLLALVFIIFEMKHINRLIKGDENEKIGID